MHDSLQDSLRDSFFYAGFYRIIDHFIQYDTLQDRRYDAPGPSYTVVTEETVDEVEK